MPRKLLRKRNIVVAAALGAVVIVGWELLIAEGALALVGGPSLVEALPGVAALTPPALATAAVAEGGPLAFVAAV